jgi:hypothetical protein
MYESNEKSRHSALEKRHPSMEFHAEVSSGSNRKLQEHPETRCPPPSEHCSMYESNEKSRRSALENRHPSMDFRAEVSSGSHRKLSSRRVGVERRQVEKGYARVRF